MLECGANINVKNSKGQTPLHGAAYHKSVDVTIYLLKKGANVNEADQFGSTPLHLAELNNNIKIVDVLLQHGADSTKISADKHQPV